MSTIINAYRFKSKLNLKMNSNASFYIPRMSSSNSKEGVVEVFKTLGTVSRVDFTNINKKQGFVENLSDPIKSAFVHLINLTELGIRVKAGVSEGETYKINPGVHSSDTEYWLILPTHSPIQETMMNNSQIVENCKFLEKKVNDQATTIQMHEFKIKSLEDDLAGIKTVVYHLLSGLYNQGDQSGIMNKHLQSLYPDYEPYGSSENVSEWDNWPTTRQGDKNETRIAALEKKIAEMYVDEEKEYQQDSQESYYDSFQKENEEAMSRLTFVHPHNRQEEYYGDDEEKEEDEEDEDTMLLIRKQREKLDEFDESISVSTHSSMPSLIECSDSDF